MKNGSSAETTAVIQIAAAAAAVKRLAAVDTHTST
jgi:hypothetical protein